MTHEKRGRTYKEWLCQTYGREIAADMVNAKTNVPLYLLYFKPCQVMQLVEFAEIIEKTLDGNVDEKRVFKMRDTSAQD